MKKGQSDIAPMLRQHYFCPIEREGFSKLWGKFNKVGLESILGKKINDR